MALWTPAEISPSLWLDASDSGTITIDTGVSNWADKSANGNAAVQDTTSRQPSVISSAQNGLDVIRLDGVDDSFKLSSEIENNEEEWNIFVAWDPSVASDSTDNYILYASGDLFILLQVYDGDKLGVYNNSIIAGPSATTGGQILHFDVSTSGGFYRDGQLLQSQSFSPIAIDGTIGLFGHAFGSSYVSAGDIFEIVFVKGAIDSASREKVEGYLAWKWGLDSNLDSGHTYKSAAPEVVNPDELVSHVSSGGVVMAGSALVGYDVDGASESLIHVASGGMVLGGSALVDYYADEVVELTDISRQIDLYHPRMVIVSSQFDIDYSGLSAITVQVDLDYAATGGVVAQVDLDYEGLENTLVSSQVDLLYLGDPGSILSDVAWGIEIDGTPLESITNIEFVFTVQAYKHTASVTLADLDDYARCQVGDTLSLVLVEETIPMMIVDRGRNRSVDGWLYTISLESPGAVLDYPFSSQISGYLTGTASVIASTLSGVVPLSWSTVNWPIAGEIMDAADRTPRELLTALADTSGGLLRSEFDGSLTVEPDYPVPVTSWDATVADYTINTVTQMESDSVSGDLTPIYNAVYVGSSSTESDSISISIATEAQDDGSVLARVYTVPWDDDNDFDQTGGSAVSVERIGDVVQQHTELVEVVGGEGSVSLPALSLVSYSYQADALGTLTLDSDGHFTTSVAAESLVSVTYQSKSRNYLLRSTTGDDLQIVAESEDSAGSDDTIFVSRTPGGSVGDAIYDQLLTNDAVRRERGRNFIDASCSLRESVQLSVFFTQLYRPGSLVEINDPVDGIWKGLLREQSGSIAITDNSLSVSSTLTVERVQQ